MKYESGIRIYPSSMHLKIQSPCGTLLGILTDLSLWFQKEQCDSSKIGNVILNINTYVSIHTYSNKWYFGFFFSWVEFQVRRKWFTNQFTYLNFCVWKLPPLLGLSTWLWSDNWIYNCKMQPDLGIFYFTLAGFYIPLLVSCKVFLKSNFGFF